MQHKLELDEKSTSFQKSINLIIKEFQNMNNDLKESLKSEFRVQHDQIKAEQERKLNERLTEMRSKIQQDLNEKFELRLADFQENLIRSYESEFEDMQLKVRQIISQSIRDEQTKETAQQKQVFDRIERDLKSETEKYAKNYFLSHGELLKEQIKSGLMQEHLILNSKLEKLFKASEEKRRKTNMLFARHMSGLNFFVDNAHKQLSILKECQKDLFKNRDLVEYYGDLEASGSSSFSSALKNDHNNNHNDEDGDNLTLNSSDSFFSLNINSNENNNIEHFKTAMKNFSFSKDNLFEFEDENKQPFIQVKTQDENLLNDV
jgi:hypothetical protein